MQSFEKNLAPDIQKLCNYVQLTLSGPNTTKDVLLNSPEISNLQLISNFDVHCTHYWTLSPDSFYHRL